jgi:ABC-type uncharacterized transport system ATPase component
VTHSEDHAQYGSRIINLLDGRVLSDHKVENADERHRLKVDEKTGEAQSV